jgi:hypothetical protein
MYGNNSLSLAQLLDYSNPNGNYMYGLIQYLRPLYCAPQIVFIGFVRTLTKVVISFCNVEEVSLRDENRLLV